MNTNTPDYQQAVPPPLPQASGGPIDSRPNHGMSAGIPSLSIISAPKYDPASFHTLYLWAAILFGISIPLMFILVGFLTLIGAIVVSSVLMYRCWNQIQDGSARTSAGAAVGLGFVPFFNLYWMFPANWGLTQDLNKFNQRHGLQLPRLNEGLMLTMCILIVCSLIPYLGILSALAGMIIWFITWAEVKNVSAAIAKARLGQ